MVRLFFDIQITGHHSEYLEHLIQYTVSKQAESDEYVFVVHPHFSKRFPRIITKVESVTHIKIIEITEEELSKSEYGGLVRRSFVWYKLVSRYAKAYRAKHVCLLYFNLFQVALTVFKPSFSITGILFLQFFRMPRETFKDRLKYYRKYLITKLYTGNRSIKRIFVLNDSQAVNYLNNEFKTDIFKMLSDPIPELTPLEHFDLHSHYKIDKRRKVFLHLGSLSERKGTLEFIDSAKELDSYIQDEVAYLIAGKSARPEMDNAIKKSIMSANDNTNVQIIWENSFVSNEMMKSLFDGCYAVVIPYKNAEASSGILGHSAASGKLVITTGKGLLKEIVQEYNLGLLINEVTPFNIANKINQAANAEFKFNPVKEFIDNKSPLRFAMELIVAK